MVRSACAVTVLVFDACVQNCLARETREALFFLFVLRDSAEYDMVLASCFFDERDGAKVMGLRS